ncbi:hypothetical protein LOTGIDRAFT_230870 [Lottia gigantea]|uniref:Uncharacterized protein n=1 Tax=Lottia gigantea TaxID=225164 RepID=V4AY19_LOTGI|nr:hypothetical protein LOTGIDRAFT_230870 [Lottia gigantea]ESO99935.1 hypothetical protein LOTGIDRAFT_230870 [Lottia gigantea]
MGKQKKNRQGADKTFQKKKVKVGKKLPKAANATKTSFKTKTIQIIQQLKKDQDQATTKRKLNIKDLLSQCMHYNMTVRLGAAQGMKELLSVSEEPLIDNLGTVIDRAGSLMTDKDYTVREAVLKLFEPLFNTVSPLRMTPFFPVLCAHLCCAMTHINAEIQQDSLLLFDLLLKAYPDLIVHSSNQLLSNFVEQISKQKFKNSSSGMRFGPSTKDSSKLSLSIAPNRQGSAQKWQSKVLNRLLKLLTIVLKDEDNGIESQENVLRVTENENHFMPFQNFMKKNWLQPGFAVRTPGMVQTSAVDLTDIQSIKQLVLNLFPLLIQCWVEAHDSEKNDGSLLYSEATSIRTTVLDIILLLIEYGTKNSDSLDVLWSNWLSEQFEVTFVNYFTSSFPFELLHGKKNKNKKQKVAEVNISPENLNLAVCSVMTKFIKTPSDFQQQSWIQPILKYIRYNIKTPDLALDIRRHLLQVLTSLIYAMRPNDQLLIFEDCVYRYQRAHHLSQEKQMFIHYFAKVIFKSEGRSDLDRPLISFLDSLPDLLLEVGQSNDAISTKIMSVIKNAVTSNITPVLKKWQSYIDLVYNIDTGVFLTSSKPLKKSMIEILYWLPALTKNQLKLFVNLIHHEGLEFEEGKYLIQVLQERFNKIIGEKINLDLIADQLGFLMLVMLGPKHSGIVSDVSKPVTDWSVIEQHFWKKQLSLDTFICKILQADFLPYADLVSDVVWSSLEKRKKNNLYTVLCLLSVLIKFPTSNISQDFTDLTITFACNLFSTEKTVESSLSSLYTLLEDAVCQPYLKTFIEATAKMILNSADQETAVNLTKMINVLTQISSLKTLIMESSSTDKGSYCGNLEKVTNFVQSKYSCVTNESWLSNLEYFTLQLK